MKKRIGFFGGCFNPPTIAHMKLIELAIDVASLDKVYFVPMGNFYEKKELIDINHRINMLKLMIKNNPKLEVSDMQAKIDKRLYAIDSFRLISEKYKDSDNFFIMGSDNFAKIKNWKNSDELLNNYKYIVLDRNNLDAKNVVIVNGADDFKKVSSSEVRKKIHKNEKINNLVVKDVENYIIENKLYN